MHLLRTSVGLIVLVAALLILTPASPAYADDCAAIGGVLFAGPPAECRISGPHTVAPGAYTLDETLHFLAGGIINVSPTPGVFSVTITGGLLMDAGSEFRADAAAGDAGTITVNTSGNITLKGGNPGAIISANTPAGSCPPSFPNPGTINLTAAGNVTTEDGSKINTIGGCGKGVINISGKIIDIEGEVLSEGTTSKGAGGPITVAAVCLLTVGDTGTVESIGRDPGADLVKLSGGCQVVIYGLVASTGPGHSATLPGGTSTLCEDPVNHPSPFHGRACVQILAGDNTLNGDPSIVIDRRPPHNGEVHADTGFSGGVGGFGWIDIFAKGAIEIDGVSTPIIPTPTTSVSGSSFVVHANQGRTSGHGGLIAVKSTLKGVTLLGLAIQASDTASGSKGGTVTVQAKLDVNLNNSNGEIEVLGSALGGANREGGHIGPDISPAFPTYCIGLAPPCFGFGIKSFGTAPSTGSILVTAPFTLDVTGGGPPANGSVNLQACGAIQFAPFGPANGTIIPAGIVPTGGTGICGGAPTVPANLLPDCVAALCGGGCPCVVNFTPTTAVGGVTLTLNGNAMDHVTSVIFGATCDPGSAAANGTVPQASFTSQTTGSIQLAVPAGLSSGTYKMVIIDDNAPSGSCCAPGVFTRP